MIDGIKIRCLGTNPMDWEGNSLLQFSSSVDVETGEILSNGKTAYYKGLYFQLIPSTVSNNTHCIVKGSLAKYYNNGRNNAFDYSMKMLIETMEELYKTFKINPFTAKIQSFEYGVNICTTQSVKHIVNGIRAFQNDTFVGLKDEGVFCGKQLKRQEYLYKVYDKGLVADIHDINILRVEFAVKSIKTARKFKVETLSDLVKKESLELLKINLLNIWNNIIFYDSGMRWRKMDKEQKEKMLYYLDATNWIKFSKMQRLRAKAHFKSLFSLFCSSKTQVEIGSLLVKKIDELDSDLSYHLRNFLSLENSSKPILELLPITYLDKAVESNINEPKKEVKNKPKKDVAKKSFCRITKLDISMQKEDSILISHSGLRYYFKNDKNTFDKLKNKYLSTLWENADFEIQIKEIAHNIRNTNSNQQIKQRRLYPQHQIQLFGQK
jgi:hypothetical protein